MLMKSCVLLLTLAFFPLTIQASHGATGKADGDTTRPEVPAGDIAIAGSKKTVMFSHGQGHKSIDCIVCHHPVDGRQTWSKCSSSGCHDNLAEKKGEHSLYHVMHSKSKELKFQSCLSCHAKTVAEKPDLKKELTGCSGSACHPAVKKTDEAS